MRVVSVADKPNSSARDLSGALSLDPSLTARVLRLANSAYYGLSRRVADVSFAVTVVGFPTIRAMAAATASGLFESGTRTVPGGFWEHSVATAAACSTLAGRAGVRAPEAFALGLLHDLGSALLFRIGPERYDSLLADVHNANASIVELERDVYGMGHDEAGARVFAAWRFPEEFVEAVELHHSCSGDQAATVLTPYGRVLMAAEAVASRLTRKHPVRFEPDNHQGLAALGLTAADATAVANQVKEDAAHLLQAFS
jgi:putative nucleotidyltransferase with HDIG domain